MRSQFSIHKGFIILQEMHHHSHWKIPYPGENRDICHVFPLSTKYKKEPALKRCFLAQLAILTFLHILDNVDHTFLLGNSWRSTVSNSRLFHSIFLLSPLYRFFLFTDDEYQFRDLSVYICSRLFMAECESVPLI